MTIFKDIGTFIKSGYSTDSFYKAMNMAFDKYYGKYLMLHFSYFKDKSDDLVQGQKNLTNHCISKLPDLKNKKVLEIGCGNGMQSIYLFKEYKPEHITGIDINQYSISIAREEKEKLKLNNIDFFVDNAQDISNIADNSIDIVVNIESAFHYPDKKKFLNEIFRVLKPDGHFLVADIINREKNRRFIPKLWHKGMNLHHWTDNDYNLMFEEKELKVSEKEDITLPIIKGFKNYRRWIVRNRSLGFFQNMMIRIFLFINVRINIYLFTRRRKYMLYSGVKAA